MTLKETLETARAEAQQKAGGAIEALADLAERLGLADTAQQLGDTRQQLASDRFRIVVIGRFKNGKSTLLNALLGGTTRSVTELGSGVGPMPVNPLPTTATLTRIVYADDPYVRRWDYDGTWEEWTFARFIRDAVIQPEPDENRQRFGNVREFEVGFPADLCQAGVMLYDSPGTDEDRQRTEVTLQAIQKADAAIVVFRSDVLAGEGERELAARVKAEGTRTFTVINTWGGTKVDGKLRHFTWAKLVAEESGVAYGPAVTEETFIDRDIYFVDALEAERARWANGSGAEPGMALFEARLADFLVNKRYQAHLQKFVRAAEVRAGPIEQQVRQRQAACREDEARLQQAYLEIQPQLAAIPKKLEELPPIFAKYQDKAVRELAADFERFVARLRAGLKSDFADVPLPSVSRRNPIDAVMNQVKPQKLIAEAGEACGRLIADKVAAWAAGAGAVLVPINDELAGEVDSVIDSVQRDFDDINFQLVGLSATAQGDAKVISMRERVGAGVVGLVLGGPGGLIGGSALGFRALVPALVAQFGTGLVLAVLGLTAPVVVIPAALIVAIAAGFGFNFGALEKKVRATVIEQALASLQTMAVQGTASITEQVAAEFHQVEEAVLTSARAVVEEESRSIHVMADLNRQSQDEKTRELKMLEDVANRLTDNLAVLRAADVTAQQVA